MIAQGLGSVTRGIARDEGLTGSGRRAAVGCQISVHDQDTHLFRRDGHLLGHNQAHDSDQTLAKFGCGAAHFESAVFEEFDIRARFVRCATAEASVLVGCGKPPGSHQIRIDRINNGVERTRGMLPHFRVHLVDTFYQTNRLVQDLSCVGNASHMQRVHAAQFDRIELQFFCQRIHHRLDCKGRLRDAKATVRARRRVIGIHRVTVSPYVRDVVRSSRVGGGASHDLLAQRGVRACVAVKFSFHGKQAAVLLCTQLNTYLRRVPLGVHEQTLVAVEEQLDRPLSHVGEHRNMDLSHHVFLAAESAAHQLTHDAYTLLRPTHYACHLLPVLIGNLRTDINFHAAIGQRHGDAAFGFHKGMFGRRRVEGMFKNHVRFSETSIHVAFANLDVFEQVAFFMDLRDAVLPCLDRICDDRLELELGFDQTEGSFGNFRCFRSDDGQRVPHIADAFPDPDHDRPIEHNQSMIVFGRNIFGG